jgi:pimeloyl-ACP methyl ester carboxylesterase
MNNKSILFLHANGFPSKMYLNLFQDLIHNKLHYIDKLAHKDYSVNADWTPIYQEVEHFLKHDIQEKPLIGIGHSMGGVLLYKLAHHYPNMFSKIILLDAPILNRYFSYLVYLLKRTGLIEYVTPAHRTKNRTIKWNDTTHAYDHFRSKNVFKNFTDESIQNYISFGLDNIGSELHLSFKRETEYQIYRGIPHDTHLYKVHDQVEKYLFYGDRSDVFNSLILNHMKRIGFICHKVEGSHLFPFEQTDKLKNDIEQIILS